MKLTEFKKPTTTWLQLTDSRNNSTNWGELMFSLSYLPTAERLTVVVVKARNLKLDRENGNSPADNKTTGLENVFVKVRSIGTPSFPYCVHKSFRKYPQ